MRIMQGPPIGHHKVREVEIIPVIRITHTRGLGTRDSVFREVTTYWTLDGEKLFEIDPYSDEREEAEG